MVVSFPDAVAHQVAFLKPRLTETVSAVVPNPRPNAFVRVERSGGPAGSVAHDRPMMTYFATATSILAAGELIGKVRALVRSQPEFLNEVGGPVFLPDPDDGLPRYQITIQLQLRGVQT